MSSLPYNSRRRFLKAMAAAASPHLLSGCAVPATNFSQQPGFDAYYTQSPRSDLAANAAEQTLLTRHRPRFYLPPGHAGMIHFYEDYIARGTLIDGAGRLAPSPVTPAILNAHRNDPLATFTHEPPSPSGSKKQRPTLFGRVDHDVLEMEGKRYAFSFLTYHAVFRHSGIAAGLEAWRESALAVVGDLDDWHQLDHYTSATVVLDTTQRPVALMLQQHNYQHTVVFGAEHPWPSDNRPRIDVAARSNELYPHSPQRLRRRAARFGSPEELRYLMGFGKRPWVAGEDVTEGHTEVQTALEFLPPSDAFYSFQGFLGARRRVAGRDGPPGADFNTWPTLKPWTSQMLMGFWRPGDLGDLARLDAGYGRTGRAEDFVAAQALPFLQAIGLRP